jgi:hypothetical protein
MKTVQIPDNLHQQLRTAVSIRGMSMAGGVESAVRIWIGNTKRLAERVAKKLKETTEK